MKTVTLGLAFRPDSSELPAAAAIHLKFYGKSGHRFGPVDLNLLTPECLGPKEMDRWINKLHQELEILRKESLSRFRRRPAGQ